VDVRLINTPETSIIMILSVTNLSSYLYCARKLYLEKVLGLFEIPKGALIKGSIRHDVYDKINKKDEAIVKTFTKKILLREIEERYKKNYAKVLRETIIKKKRAIEEVGLNSLDMFKKNWYYFQHEAKIRSMNVFNYMIDHRVFGNKLWETLMPKIKSELRINSKKFPLKGIIDQIEVWHDSYVPIELKTGKAPSTGVWPGHRVQLGCYALLAEELFNTKISYGVVKYVDTFESRQVTFNSFMREEILVLIRKVKELLNASELPDFCGNENKCNACSLKPLCYDEKIMDQKMKELQKNREAQSLNIT